jgi:uncharacterized membrane protein
MNAEASREAGIEKETGRIEAFSDGVLAIAITLLVLEIRLPEGEGALTERLLEIWPSYFAYLLSFITIGVMWLNHHQIFKVIKRLDNTFILLNTLLLLLITFVNFPTIVLADYLGEADEKVAGVFYAGTFVVTAIIYNLLWRYASHNGRLLDTKADPTYIRSITNSYRFGPIYYGIAVVLALFNVPLSLIWQLGLVVFYGLTGNRKF